jgi:hypothetical protein
MHKKNRSFLKMISCLVTATFLFSGVSHSGDLSAQKLSPPAVSGEQGLTEEAEDFRRDVMDDMKFMSVAYSIAQEYFSNGGNAGALHRALLDKFRWSEDFLKDQYIDLGSIYDDGSAGDGKIRLRFASKDGKSAGVMDICPAESAQGYRASGERWEIVGEYAFFIERDEVSGNEVSRDLKGANAPETDPVLKDHIQKARVAELYIDPVDGKLKGNRVKWIKDYVSGLTPENMYRGYEIDVFQLFSKSERKALEEWMRAHSVRGSPVRIRVVLGNATIGWRDDVDHSNIAHAGVRDNVIYIGSLLLKELMRDGNEAVRSEILDNDEFRHLQGLGHGTDEDVEKRLASVHQIFERKRLQEICDAMGNNDVNYLLKRLKDCLKESSNDSMFELLSAVNDIAMGQVLYPVESTYPIKHAVALLSREEQDILLDKLTGSASRAKGYRYQIIISEIILMLDESRKLQEWVRVYAPHLEGRSLWQISPEIWHEAGGLARVMQYHGAGMKELLGQADVRFRHIEPHYQNRVDPQGKAQSLDYTKREQITHPIQGRLEEVARFTVTVGGKEVNAIASRGVNDLGIEVYLIGDEEGFFTHSLYNYRNPWENKQGLPTWEEFSVFYSKASLELVKIIEGREKSAMEELNKEWKAPVMHLNDSQVALVSAYRKIFHDKDPVLGEAVVAFTTHTYGNRKEYPLGEGYGDNVLDFMEIPLEYRELFKHCQRAGDVYDMASAGLRAADWQGAVARAHRDDVYIYDDWVNFPEDPALAAYYRDMGVEYSLVAVSNGDHRSNTMKYFIEKLKKLYGEEIDVEHPTADQVSEAKKLAKLELRVSDNKKYYSTHDNEDWERSILSPDQMVVSYSGRLVPEKAGRVRAFIDSNVENMLKSGIQVVIYGNVQSNNTTSDKLRDDLIALIEKLKEKKYPGRLVFVPRFSLDDQRALLAASDVQVQDSHPSTEAAGFTEADVSACGGIEVGTPRLDNKVGEGLFQAQGVPMNLDVPGEGNVLTPKNLDAASYLDAILKLNEEYENGNLKYYQATSVRLSRILEARLTSAAYLREFSKAIEYKEYKKKRVMDMEKQQKAEKENDIYAKDEDDSLLAQVYGSDPRIYAVYRICRRVARGDIEGAAGVFFAAESFQGRAEGLETAADVFNRLISMAKKGEVSVEDASGFASLLIDGMVEFRSDKSVSGALQLMAGQALTVLSWMHRGLTEGSEITITADHDKMVKASDKQRGPSFISVPRSIGIDEVGKEGEAGFYWRGVEKIKKLGKNVLSYLEYGIKPDIEEFVMYLMDHGAVPVPEPLKAATQSGEISTLHETFFVNDLLPGSTQTTSTGSGHFQGEKIDLKYITEGRGIQVNVQYGYRGGIIDVIAHPVKKGDWTVALPGYVDYTINLGGLRFNDISVSLSSEEARPFNKLITPPEGTTILEEKFLSDLKKMGEALNVEASPYIGMISADGPSIVEAQRVPIFRWIDSLSVFSDSHPEGLVYLYETASSMDDIKNAVRELGLNYKDIFSQSRVYQNTSAGKEDVINIVSTDSLENTDISHREKPAPISLKGADAVEAYIDDSARDINSILSGENKNDKLIRVPVEIIEGIGPDNIKGLLLAIQSTQHGYIELYSSERPEGVKDIYGIVAKDLPENLKAEKRTRSNTVTLFPVFKGEELSVKRNKRWGGEDYQKSIISPLGFNYDRTGVIRSVILGLSLSEVAGDVSMDENSDLVRETFERYKRFCISQGQSERGFDLTAKDIMNMARGQGEEIIHSLNKLIKLLPIMPVNTEELKVLYERMREVLIRA